jgi:hypothetical protein
VHETVSRGFARNVEALTCIFQIVVIHSRAFFRLKKNNDSHDWADFRLSRPIVFTRVFQYGLKCEVPLWLVNLRRTVLQPQSSV